jgi:hypothetical protein
VKLVRLWLPGVLLATVASCAALFDEPSQCKTDGDCARFDDAVCDIANGVCIRPNGDNDAGDVPLDASPGPNDAPPESAPIDRCIGTKSPGVVGTKLDGGTKSEITGNVTLGCDTDWTLDTTVLVRAGATLTIEAGTTIRAKTGTNAAIIVSPGARIVASGTRDKPIVLTSEAATPAAGDWRGLYLVGLAPPAGQGAYEDDPDLAWGGSNAEDDSGVLGFVRIEYARSGLSLVGVGRKTKIDYVQVRRTVENCFMFYGGTVDAKHLVCQSPGDEQFEWYLGHQGRIQFVFGQKTPMPPVFGGNGLLIDDARPVIHNATICGDTPTPNGYGVFFRDNATVDLNGAIVMGWFSGLDATGSLATPGNIRSSILFANAVNPAYDETDDETNPDLPRFNDDNGFDELAWFAAPERKNALTNPNLVGCFDAKSPKPWPAASLTANAATPPNDGFFDTTAQFIGAFKDETDTWMTGAWVRFDDK